MNLALILILLTALPITARWPWYAIAGAALGMFSVEWQVLSILHWRASIGWLALIHATALLFVLSQSRARAQLVGRLEGLIASIQHAFYDIGSRRARLAVVGCVAAVIAVLTMRAVLFVPEAADPYHLVRVWALSTYGSLQPIASEDSKINTLGYLYELTLADGTLGSGALQAWVGMQGPLLYIAYVLVVGWALLRHRSSPGALAIVLLCLVPVVFHQGILVKNDLFAALLLIPALVLLYRFTATTPVITAVWIGLLAGLAASVKVTTATFGLAAALFLPWTPAASSLKSRLAAVAGFVIGVVTGGVVWVAVQNVSVYGSLAGPTADTGNVNESFQAALISLARFVISWFDMNLLTRQIWPGRGGWGGAFGPPFIWAIALLLLRYRQEPAARRALGIAICCLVPFGLIYPDADVAHRMAIAPAVFVILAAIGLELRRGTLSGRTPVAIAAAVAVIASGALLARSSLAYLRQFEYLRVPAAAIALADRSNLAETQAWRLREANASMEGASHVCSVMQENMLGLRRYDFEPMVVTTTRNQGYVYEWQADAPRRCDAVLVGPNSYPEPPPAVAAWLEKCLGQKAATGLDIGIRARRCQQPFH
jgi:hypothetical protein